MRSEIHDVEVLSTAEQETKNCLAMAVVPIVAKSAVAAMALPKSLVREKGLPCCSAGESSGEPFLLPYKCSAVDMVRNSELFLSICFSLVLDGLEIV